MTFPVGPWTSTITPSVSADNNFPRGTDIGNITGDSTTDGTTDEQGNIAFFNNLWAKTLNGALIGGESTEPIILLGSVWRSASATVNDGAIANVNSGLSQSLWSPNWNSKYLLPQTATGITIPAKNGLLIWRISFGLSNFSGPTFSPDVGAAYALGVYLTDGDPLNNIGGGSIITITQRVMNPQSPSPPVAQTNVYSVTNIMTWGLGSTGTRTMGMRFAGSVGGTVTITNPSLQIAFIPTV